MEERNVSEPDAFALKIMEIQYNTVRSEIEQYLARMHDVLKLALATIPIFSGALIALVADQGTWEVATERPILLGLFCLLSPMFIVIAVYLGNLGIAQYKAVTRAADYLKVHFEDYVFQPILRQLEREKDGHIFREARLTDFLFWENYLSQHGYDPSDHRFRSDYDADKHLMTAFLVFLTLSVIVISAICVAAFLSLALRSTLISGFSGAVESAQTLIFESIVIGSSVLFGVCVVWAITSFRRFFAVIKQTGKLSSGLQGGLSAE